ncbi:MAG: DEAD/DEAH box helicase [Acidobacteria bacterium]|nr:DEAD/DEAH box helicase [Acidobacteriota bacterium]MDA1233393.1 DEAD/DEAH box helicase [Acidobacteriota bacterium]
MSENLEGTTPGFERFELDPVVQRGVTAAGFKEPRPIQAKTIPAGLAGQDVLGLAETGTGKTAAFAVPILNLLVKNRRPGPRALIIAPTRELAMQIDADFKKLGQFAKVKTVTIFGGVSSSGQINALRKNPDILVVCPGRLLDLYEQRAVDLARIEVLVLDEADHMFDMGFLPSIQRIIGLLPKKRQNLLFSATMPPAIRGLADKILQKPVVVELNRSAPASTIDHALYMIPAAQKLLLLRHVIAEPDFETAIVFSRTKHGAKRLADQLTRHGHNAIALQGNMSQAQRDRAMNGFRRGEFKILVATDVAARGIDVAGISHVINFDVPTTPENYTHRIGRTGRAELTGKAYTFVAGTELSAVHAIERLIKQKIERRKIPVLDEASLPAPPPRPKVASAPPAEKRAEGGGQENGRVFRKRSRSRRPGGGSGGPSSGGQHRPESGSRPAGGGRRRPVKKAT